MYKAGLVDDRLAGKVFCFIVATYLRAAGMFAWFNL
jgi:hypothetical protein